MRSPLAWWLTCKFRTFKHAYQQDKQLRIALIVVPVTVAAMSYLASNSYLLERFL